MRKRPVKTGMTGKRLQLRPESVVTPERWKRIEELYHAASVLPSGERAAFLRDAGDDEAVRRDVESLLNGATSGGGLLDGPALVSSADIVSDLAATAMVGRTLGGYHLQTLIGAGGMGEVYRARDQKLGRDVAIKVLPPAFTSDADRLARFEREARMLAALNHPNICAIYGFEHADGIQFLVLELVDGETLADRLRSRTAVLLGEAVAIARQIADALEAAHEKGIIHRDLKPSNITITPAGLVKVLDFGLAKAVAIDGATQDLSSLSSDGAGGRREGLIGTAAYMSPEQARGLPADKRSDIWAFGCVLYEMLTGRTAFAGDTVSDSIARILEREPDWAALPPSTPASIRRLLIRCLAKDPKKRLRDIGDSRLELDAIDEVLPGDSAAPAGATIRTAWLPWAAVVALALMLVAMACPLVRVAPANPLANARFTPLTNWEGAEEGAEISPDGKWVAFLADHDGEFDIWLIQLGGGNFSNLTQAVPPLAPSGSIVRKLGFSANGSQIWFNPGDRKPLVLMPLTGGPSRAFLPADANTPAWSPDGNRLVYFHKPPDAEDPMFLADATGANPSEVPLPRSGLHRNNPVWSPDGWIYFVAGSEPQNEMNVDVWRARPTGGEPERLTNQHAAVNYPALINARTLLYVAREEDGSGPWLWALDIERKTSTRVSSGVDQYTSVAASRDGRRLVATVANPSSGLWQVPLTDRIADDGATRPYPLPVPTGQAFAPRFGGGLLFYLSARGTGDGLWKVEHGQGSHVWRNVDAALSEPAAVSPAGNRLALVVRQNGKRTLWIMSNDGSNRRTLAESIDIQGAAGQGAVDWTPDGKWIVAGGRDAQGSALFKIPVDGGGTQRIVEGTALNPVVSPDGTLVVYAARSVVGQVQLRGTRLDGTAVELPPVLVRPGGYRFLPSGKGLVYLPFIHSQDFWQLDFETKQQRQLTRLSNFGALRTFDITADGKSIVFDRLRQNSNIVLIELP